VPTWPAANGRLSLGSLRSAGDAERQSTAAKSVRARLGKRDIVSGEWHRRIPRIPRSRAEPTGATSVPTNQHRVSPRPREQAALRPEAVMMTMTMRGVEVVVLSLRLVYRVTFSRAPCRRRRQRTGPKVLIGVTELRTSEGGSSMRDRPSRTCTAYWTPMDAVRQGNEPATRRCFRTGCRWTCFGKRCERETVTRGRYHLNLRNHAEAPSTRPPRPPLSSLRDREQDSLAHSREPPCPRRSTPARPHSPPTRHAQSIA
jgi:hypothetical protein